MEAAAETVTTETSVEETQITYPGFASAPMAKPAQVESISVGTPEIMADSDRAEVYVSARVGGSASETNSATSEASKTL